MYTSTRSKLLKRNNNKRKTAKKRTRQRNRTLGGIWPWSKKPAEQTKQTYSVTAEIANNIKDYKFYKRIGNGGFGETAIYTYKPDEKKYALKKIKMTRTNERAIRNELAILRYLKNHCSKYIMCYHDDFENDGYKYIVMELLHGDEYTSLPYFINSLPYGDDDRIKIICNLCSGLELMHQLKVAHRDIKPDNIMINTKTMDIKYIDFGLAYKMDMEDEDSSYIPYAGTPTFMDPNMYQLIRELFEKGEDSDDDLFKLLQRFDKYALGITIFLLLSRISVDNILTFGEDIFNECDKKQLKICNIPEILDTLEKSESLPKTTLKTFIDMVKVPFKIKYKTEIDKFNEAREESKRLKRILEDSNSKLNTQIAHLKKSTFWTIDELLREPTVPL